MLTQIMDINGESLELAERIIASEGVVAFPTETVYGLGGSAFSSAAVKKIYEAKGRPSDNPLIAHVHKDYDISSLVFVEHGYAEDLRRKFVPGPLTMVYKSKGVVSPLVSCGLDTLALRCPADENAQKFLRAVKVPIAAPSANVSKHVSPVTAQHVYEDLNGRIPLILNGGRCVGGIESTVVDVTTHTPIILRSGLVTYDMIKSVAGKCEYAQYKDGDKIISPGVKYKHYAPRCSTVFFEREDWKNALEEYKSALFRALSPIIICDDAIAEKLVGARTITLGHTSKDYAANVYDALRRAESVSDYIIGIGVEGDSQVDVGVMNRFRKACKGD